MAFHKTILQWQAEHPIATWTFWILVWLIVVAVMVWPRQSL